LKESWWISWTIGEERVTVGTSLESKRRGWCCWEIPELKHTQIYVVRQLAYSTELLSCINHSKKQYKQRRRRKLFSTQLHSHKLSLLFSLLFCSLCVFYPLTRSSSLSLYVYKMGVKGHKSCLDLCPPFVSSTMCQVGD
jgi:hypothetical protein